MTIDSRYKDRRLALACKCNDKINVLKIWFRLIKYVLRAHDNICQSPYVTIRPFSLRNNLVTRAVEILLKSFAGSHSA